MAKTMDMYFVHRDIFASYLSFCVQPILLHCSIRKQQLQFFRAFFWFFNMIWPSTQILYHFFFICLDYLHFDPPHAAAEHSHNYCIEIWHVPSQLENRKTRYILYIYFLSVYYYFVVVYYAVQCWPAEQGHFPGSSQRRPAIPLLH